MDAVKLEGGATAAANIEAIMTAGIPVMGHVGLLPQRISMHSGFRVQGRDPASIRRLIDDALALEQAGCFAIVLEAIPDRVARIITEKVTVPTIGIGAGPDCDAQVLVFHDMMGLYDQLAPRFVKRYANVHELMLAALKQYKTEVEAGQFPAVEHVYTVDDDILEQLYP
jgi:3-methyl-2-oxobutanoate hydroxymethyltransferase